MRDIISPHRQLKEVQNKAGDLQNENTGLHNKVAILQNKVASLKSDRAKLQNMNFAQEIDVKLFQKLFMEVSGGHFVKKKKVSTTDERF